MKPILSIFMFFLAFTVSAQDSLIQSKAEECILSWADETLESYDAPRFEKLSIQYPADIHSNQVLKEEYVMWKNDLINMYESGELSKTQEQFENDTLEIQQEIDALDSALSESKDKFEEITFYMWANVLTTKGMTVYYQFEFKLDENYEITAVKESGSVGKPDDAEVIYKNP